MSPVQQLKTEYTSPVLQWAEQTKDWIHDISTESNKLKTGYTSSVQNKPNKMKIWYMSSEQKLIKQTEDVYTSSVTEKTN